MRSDSPNRALDAWARCVEYGPEEYDALYNMGLVALRIGDRARAKQSFEKFLASAPTARYARELAEVRKLLKEVS
jgi:regulator of sirC expression with transglutaminase-like and TPR domain